MSAPLTLADLLKTIVLAPSDITDVAFSHLHLDHTGNADLFVASTCIVNKVGLNWALGEPTPFGAEPKTFRGVRSFRCRGELCSHRKSRRMRIAFVMQR